MIVLHGDNSAWVDVDDTLVAWQPSKELLEKRGIEIMRPGVYYLNESGQLLKGPDVLEKVLPHLYHIEQIKRHKLRGHLVIVWSQGGSLWAERVVKALGLEGLVDLVISKPTWVYDDKKPEEFMPKPYWFKDEEQT